MTAESAARSGVFVLKGMLWLPVFVAVVAAVYGLATLYVHALDAKDLRQHFEGACTVLGGEVHGDLCVKGSTVVLTRADYAKKENR